MGTRHRPGGNSHPEGLSRLPHVRPDWQQNMCSLICRSDSSTPVTSMWQGLQQYFTFGLQPALYHTNALTEQLIALHLSQRMQKRTFQKGGAMKLPGQTPSGQ